MPLPPSLSTDPPPPLPPDSTTPLHRRHCRRLCRLSHHCWWHQTQQLHCIDATAAVSVDQSTATTATRLVGSIASTPLPPSLSTDPLPPPPKPDSTALLHRRCCCRLCRTNHQCRRHQTRQLHCIDATVAVSVDQSIDCRHRRQTCQVLYLDTTATISSGRSTAAAIARLDSSTASTPLPPSLSTDPLPPTPPDSSAPLHRHHCHHLCRLMYWRCRHQTRHRSTASTPLPPSLSTNPLPPPSRDSTAPLHRCHCCCLCRPIHHCRRCQTRQLHLSTEPPLPPPPHSTAPLHRCHCRHFCQLSHHRRRNQTRHLHCIGATATISVDQSTTAAAATLVSSTASMSLPPFLSAEPPPPTQPDLTPPLHRCHCRCLCRSIHRRRRRQTRHLQCIDATAAVSIN